MEITIKTDTTCITEEYDGIIAVLFKETEDEIDGGVLFDATISEQGAFMLGEKIAEFFTGRSIVPDRAIQDAIELGFKVGMMEATR